MSTKCTPEQKKSMHVDVLTPSLSIEGDSSQFIPNFVLGLQHTAYLYPNPPPLSKHQPGQESTGQTG